MWLEELAAGYLRQYETIRAEQRSGFWGYAFTPGGRRRQVGFLVGFLIGEPKLAARTRVAVHLPECAVGAFVRPAGSRLHQRLVRQKASPFRRGFERLSKYSARRPRFEFYENDWRAILRHVPLAAFPPGEEEKYARNFFIESLALLVRSGLPDALSG
ncbi:MAG: hypothetical protein ACRD35_05805 [Candidatus Acidiferrales bacterium]